MWFDSITVDTKTSLLVVVVDVNHRGKEFRFEPIFSVQDKLLDQRDDHDSLLFERLRRREKLLSLT
jgi:hypothetical protein